MAALSVSERALPQFTRLSKAWKAWKEWATGMSYPAYPVPCSNIIFHSYAECKKLLSIFGIVALSASDPLFLIYRSKHTREMGKETETVYDLARLRCTVL
ncbi:hypothetical protein T10_13 [Trichinella papuae]|uniref:Uncharacterized protein n=1 Tax=Trichinella papuae TaxID=268474 RepID=A0A0V1N994_9BILA|nr:hypothetical protein T10_13 [Trichinella papuae]